MIGYEKGPRLELLGSQSVSSSCMRSSKSVSCLRSPNPRASRLFSFPSNLAHGESLEVQSPLMKMKVGPSRNILIN